MTTTAASDHAELVAFAVACMRSIPTGQRHAQIRRIAEDEPGAGTVTRFQAAMHLFLADAACIAGMAECMTSTGDARTVRRAERECAKITAQALKLLHKVPDLAECMRGAMQMVQREIGPRPATVPVEAMRGGTPSPHSGTHQRSTGTATGTPAPFTYRHRSRR